MTSWHDSSCEWFSSRTQTCLTCGAWGDVRAIHCHCASRLYALCDGCKSGQHLKHAEVAQVFGTNRPCQCDLCAEEVPDVA